MISGLRRLIFIIIFLAAVVMAGFGYAFVRTWLTPLTIFQPTDIKVYPGTGLDDLAHQLQQRGLVQYPHLLFMIAEFKGYSGKLRYGQYAITRGLTASRLLENMSLGKGLLQHKITFIEGWTFGQMLQKIQAEPDLKQTLQGKRVDEIMTALGYSDQKPEGRFFPSTYSFVWGNSDMDVLKNSYKKMQQILNKEWPLRSNNIPFKTPYEVLVAASLIEKETAKEVERPIVAGVIVNRLKQRMRLQIDPTVLYGVNKPYSTPITKDDLASRNSYNTYQNYGLPPTPIDMPGLASIQAAMHPQENKYLYYVARGDGSHVFSETYEQHSIAVKQYRLLEAGKKAMTTPQPSSSKIVR